jgi:TPR repeat protein
MNIAPLAWRRLLLWALMGSAAMGNLEMRKLIVRGGAMLLKGIKTLRVWMMLLVLALPLTLTATMASTANADEFYDAVAAYEVGDYETALKIWRSLADQGIVYAQYNLAQMYENGEGVFQDLEMAYMWFALAAVNGVEKAPRARDRVKREMLEDSSLGPDAVKHAKKAARRCYDSNYKDWGS